MGESPPYSHHGILPSLLHTWCVIYNIIGQYVQCDDSSRTKRDPIGPSGVVCKDWYTRHAGETRQPGPGSLEGQKGYAGLHSGQQIGHSKSPVSAIDDQRLGREVDECEWGQHSKFPGEDVQTTRGCGECLGKTTDVCK